MATTEQWARKQEQRKQDNRTLKEIRDMKGIRISNRGILLTFNKYYKIYISMTEYNTNHTNKYFKEIERRIVTKKIWNKKYKTIRIKLQECYVIEENGWIYHHELKKTKERAIMYEIINEIE